MRLWLSVVTSFFLLNTLVVAQELDFIQYIRSDPELAKTLGISKLTAEELSAWNTILNRVAESAKTTATSSQPSGSMSTAVGNNAYETKVDEDNDDVLKLDNGAIVEVTSGYMGYLGYRKDCVLYKSGSRWRIWIEGKRSYPCDILKEPSGYARKISVEEVYISEVLGDGAILKLMDGRMFEVSSIYTITTALWLGATEALLLDGRRLLNLDDGDEIIDVMPVR